MIITRTPVDMTNNWLNTLITLILVLSIFTGCQKTYIPDDDETGEEEPTAFQALSMTGSRLLSIHMMMLL
jgi:hypothetical protein